MKFILKLVIWLLLLVLLVIAGLCLWLKFTPFEISALPPLKNGDIVFQSLADGQSIGVSAATSSPYSHIGMIKLQGAEMLVVEAIGPVKETPLGEWAKRGLGGRITIMRKSGLSDADADKVLAAARKYYGKPYDIYFQSDDQAIYCSELVYNAYLRGINMPLGKVQKIGELNTDNFAIRHVIEARWQTYPPCASTKDYAGCYNIIMAQELVTPASIAADPQVETVYTNYGIFK